METTNKIMLLSPGDIKTLISYDRLLQTSADLGKNREAQRKDSEKKLEKERPLFYTKPIYAAKDYDPL